MGKESDNFPLLAKVINGGIAGIVGVTCTFPLDLVKTRLQNQKIGPNGEKMYANILDCFKKIYRAEGFLGMYRGSGVTILLITPEKAIKLTANDYFRHFLTLPNGTLPILRQMLAGGLAGVFQIIVTTPLELLKIQLQDAGRLEAAAKAAGKSEQRLTTSVVVKNLIKEKGIFGLYKGLGPTALRDVTFSVIYFPLFATLNDAGPRRSNNSGEAVAWWSLVSGLIAASFSSFCVTPLDVIKTRIQRLRHAAGDNVCLGVSDCIRKTYINEGPRAFFNGGLCRVVAIAPLFGIAQMFYFLGVGEKIISFFGRD